MGIAVTPSFRKHHGYRTRDQPPARQARRYGFGGIARCRVDAFRRLAPIKKPAAANAAGSDHGRFHAFREGCGADVHPFQVAGGSTFGAAGPCVVFDHSLLQETSAGRNLITVFSTVNNLSQIIFAARAPFVRRTCARCIDDDAGKRASMRSQQHARFLHASIGAACSDCSDATMRISAMIVRTRCMPARRSRDDVDAGDANADDAMRLRVAQARLRKSARTFLAQCARARRNAHVFASPKTKNPQRFRRGFRSRDAGFEPCVSDLRFPAVRRSRPVPAVR